MKAGWLFAAFAIWWFFFHAPSGDAAYAAQLSKDLGTGKDPTIPEFGTDNILDAADAIAATGTLPHQLSTLAPPTGPGRQSQF